MNTGSAPKLQIAILAAGFSRRLGQPKSLVRVHGISLLGRTLRLVAPLASAQPMVVLPRNCARYRIEGRRFQVTFVTNMQRDAGLSSSVKCAIKRAHGSAALLLLPVDLAALQRRDLKKLLSRWRSARRRVAARRVGQSGVTPLILPRWLYPRALALTGDVGLREVVGALPSQQRLLLDLPSAALDVDTLQDLRAARRRLRASSFNP